MTCTVTLLEKVYGIDLAQGIRAAFTLLRSEVSGLSVKVKDVSLDDNGRIVVVLEGEDEEAARNFLAERHGCTRSFDELEEGKTYVGRAVNPLNYGYGFYVDVGVTYPKPKDALIPLYKLREQLLDGRKIPLRAIVDAYCFIDNLPIRVRVVKVEPASGKIEAELSNEELVRLDEWLKSRLDRVVVCGATRQQVRRAITKSGHLKDIVSLERLGLMEHAIVCKYGTDAPGIIAEIGEQLKYAALKAFIPKKVRSLLSLPAPSISS
ncbi:MAG: DUF2110 family protein [Candidatus Jordarchaeales archaeon]|nr:DUF2110 family protein [Candidatus Jordarchaeia archaeon]